MVLNGGFHSDAIEEPFLVTLKTRSVNILIIQQTFSTIKNLLWNGKIPRRSINDVHFLK